MDFIKIFINPAGDSFIVNDSLSIVNDHTSPFVPSQGFYKEYRGRKTTPVWLFWKMDYSASVSSLSSSRARMDREMRLFSESTSVIFTFTS